jgi:hypothetical protein
MEGCLDISKRPNWFRFDLHARVSRPGGGAHSFEEGQVRYYNTILEVYTIYTTSSTTGLLFLFIWCVHGQLTYCNLVKNQNVIFTINVIFTN